MKAYIKNLPDGMWLIVERDNKEESWSMAIQEDEVECIYEAAKNYLNSK